MNQKLFSVCLLVKLVKGQHNVTAAHVDALINRNKDSISWLPESEIEFSTLWQSIHHYDLASIDQPIIESGRELLDDIDFTKNLTIVVQKILKANNLLVFIPPSEIEERVKHILSILESNKDKNINNQGTLEPTDSHATNADNQHRDEHKIQLSGALDYPDWPKGLTQLQCVNIIDRTHDVKSFQFISKPQYRFVYKPGQSLSLQLVIDNKKIFRSYTLSSSPSRPYVLEITVKRDPNGLVSSWLHGHMKIGTVVEARGPNGKFNCFDTPCTNALLISAGSGITPCLSMTRWWVDTCQQVDIVFLHSAKAVKDIICRDELDSFSQIHPQFRSVITCTRPQPNEVWSGYSGRLSKEMLLLACPDLKQRTVYCCGPEPFMASVRNLLKESGFDMAFYSEESFGGAKKNSKNSQDIKNTNQNKTSEIESGLIEQSTTIIEETNKKATGDSQEISEKPRESEQSLPVEIPRGMFGLVCQQSEKTIIMDENDFILDRVEQENVFIDFSCRSGTCGTCKVKLISGKTETECEDGLDQESRQQGYILTCTTRLKSNVVIDV